MRYRKKESSEFRERGCASLVIMKRVDVFYDLVSGFSTDLDVKKKKILQAGSEAGMEHRNESTA